MLQPTDNRVIIKPLAEEAKTASGIYIAAPEAPGEGIIESVGPGKFEPLLKARVPVSLKPGQRVFYSKFNYELVEVDGEKRFIVMEDQVLAILPEVDN